MAASMRAKLQINNVMVHSETSETLYFNAVCPKLPYPPDGSDENNTFAKWTPSASLTIQISNPELAGKMQIGDTFYVDFTPAE